jgi:hypothetical protein
VPINPHPTNPTFTIGGYDTRTVTAGYSKGPFPVVSIGAMFEHKRQQPLSRRKFHGRVARQVGVAVAAVLLALAVGVVGYHEFAGLSWVDSLLDASMILGGMGPVHELRTDGAKLFASFYALFSGLVFIGVAGLVLAPFVHRMLHRFHYDDRA